MANHTLILTVFLMPLKALVTSMMEFMFLRILATVTSSFPLIHGSLLLWSDQEQVSLHSVLSCKSVQKHLKKAKTLARCCCFSDVEKEMRTSSTERSGRSSRESWVTNLKWSRHSRENKTRRFMYNTR